MLGAMLPMPRVIYSMANDGVIFRFLAYVNGWLKTPLIATLIAGLFAAVMAAMFELSSLVEMMSIGTLLAYSLVAVSVLVLRYFLLLNFNLTINFFYLLVFELFPNHVLRLFL